MKLDRKVTGEEYIQKNILVSGHLKNTSKVLIAMAELPIQTALKRHCFFIGQVLLSSQLLTNKTSSLSLNFRVQPVLYTHTLPYKSCINQIISSVLEDWICPLYSINIMHKFESFMKIIYQRNLRKEMNKQYWNPEKIIRQMLFVFDISVFLFHPGSISSLEPSFLFSYPKLPIRKDLIVVTNN